MVIYGDWRIFRRILKRDLALDRTSGRRRMVLSGRAFRTVVVAAVAIVMASFFATIIITMRQVIGTSSPDDVVLILLVDLSLIRFGEINHVGLGRRRGRILKVYVRQQAREIVLMYVYAYTRTSLN